MSCIRQWRQRVASMDTPTVVELGTKGWDGKPPRHHRDEIVALCPGARWVGTDAEAGDGVDVVADAHQIYRAFAAGSVDAVFAASVLEHLRRPWVVAASLARIVRPGGALFVQTHQTFPHHGYPQDYFRFSIEAMRELFCEESGWRVVDVEYLFPCKVVPTTNCVLSAGWNYEAEAWLNVEMFAERV